VFKGLVSPNGKLNTPPNAILKYHAYENNVAKLMVARFLDERFLQKEQIPNHA
jgi:hypothetical protein